MIDWDKPIETLAGHPARVLSTDFRSDGKEIVAVQIEYKNCSEIHCYRQDGLICGLGPAIRNRKTKREGWINICRDDRTGETIYEEGKAIDWDKPIETESGLPAKVISRNYRNIGYGECIFVQIEHSSRSYAASYSLEGNAIYLAPKLRNCKIKYEE